MTRVLAVVCLTLCAAPAAIAQSAASAPVAWRLYAQMPGGAWTERGSTRPGATEEAVRAAAERICVERGEPPERTAVAAKAVHPTGIEHHIPCEARAAPVREKTAGEKLQEWQNAGFPTACLQYIPASGGIPGSLKNTCPAAVVVKPTAKGTRAECRVARENAMVVVPDASLPLYNLAGMKIAAICGGAGWDNTPCACKSGPTFVSFPIPPALALAN